MPVRIAIDGDPGRPMIAGLSADVTVDTRDRPPQRQRGAVAAMALTAAPMPHATSSSPVAACAGHHRA